MNSDQITRALISFVELQLQEKYKTSEMLKVEEDKNADEFNISKSVADTTSTKDIDKQHIIIENGILIISEQSEFSNAKLVQQFVSKSRLRYKYNRSIYAHIGM